MPSYSKAHPEVYELAENPSTPNPMNTQTTLQKSSKRDIRALLQSDNVRQQIALALPKHLTPDRMTRVALTTINRTPKLLACTPESLLAGLMLCSQVGLEPDGRNAHLIPYGDQCQVIFDWKGLVALARRNGVKNIAADVVCENDEFQWYRNGDGLQFLHKVSWQKPRGAVYAAYCIWKDGEQFDGDVMTKDEIEGIRKRSRAGANGPWVTDWAEMAKKTVVRRASKKWPLDPEAATAFNADDDSVLPETKASRPKFAEAPKALFEAPTIATNGTEPVEDEVPMDFPATEIRNEPENPGPEKAQTEPEAPPKRGPGRPVQNFVKAIRGLLQLKGHTEAELLTFCRNTEKLDDSLSNLEEAFMVDEPGVRWIHDNWVTVDRELTRLKAEKVL